LGERDRRGQRLKIRAKVFGERDRQGQRIKVKG